MKNVIFGLGVALAGAAPVFAENVSISAVGTWGNLSMYQENEGPFWNVEIAQASGGSITGEIKPLTELGLDGFEIMRLLKLGVYDYAYGLPGYVASEDASIEGLDLAGVMQDLDAARTVADAYFPVVEEKFAEIYNAKLLQIYPFPSNILFCNSPIESISDLEGRKIRVYSASLGDFVEAVGGVGVTLPFAEVIPALERGVADCGVTATMAAYQAKWGQVADHSYKMVVSWGMAFGAMNMDKWNSLSSEQQALLQSELGKLTEQKWQATARYDANALQCLTTSDCLEGEPGGMKLVEPSEDDLKVLDGLVRNNILVGWEKRCGEECVAKWKATAGKALGLESE